MVMQLLLSRRGSQLGNLWSAIYRPAGPVYVTITQTISNTMIPTALAAVLSLYPWTLYNALMVPKSATKGHVSTIRDNNVLYLKYKCMHHTLHK